MYIAIFIGHYRICRSAASASVTYGCSRLYCISSTIARSARSVWHTGKVAEHLSDTLYKQLVCRHPDVNTRANYRRNRKPLIGDKWIWVVPSDEALKAYWVQMWLKISVVEGKRENLGWLVIVSYTYMFSLFDTLTTHYISHFYKF